MYKLYGRNTCAFGIVAEFSVPAAGSQSNPYFNVNKWGISFISLSLSSNNKTEKSPFPMSGAELGLSKDELVGPQARQHR